MKRIKWCLVLMVVALIVKLLAFVILVPAAALALLFNSLSIVLVVLIGICLLKDDPLFVGPYNCVQRCCLCPGGTNCLCAWFAFCFLTAMFSVLPVGGSDMQYIVTFISLMANPSQKQDGIKWGLHVRSSAWYALCLIFVVAVALELLAQILGAYHGYKGYQQFQQAQMGGLMDWPPARDFDMRGAPAVPPARPGMADAGGPSAPPPGAAAGPPAAGAVQPVPPQGFQPFGGHGQRLAD